MKTGTAESDKTMTRPQDSHVTPHRLAIFAGSSAEAAEFAGGLIFDHIGAGWDVKVHLVTETPEDECTLRILGVQNHMQTAHFEPSDWPELLLIGADLYDNHADIRQIVDAASRRGHSEIAMWGGEWPHELDPGLGVVEHRLSIAARAFKAHAVRSAGSDRAIDPAEQFLGGTRRARAAQPLLSPA